METQRGSVSERRSWKRGQAGGPPGKPVRLGSCWGRAGARQGVDQGGLERLRPEAAFSTEKGRRGRVSGFLPEVKFPKLVADRTQATHPDLGEGGREGSLPLYSEHTCQQSFLAANFSTLAV